MAIEEDIRRELARYPNTPSNLARAVDSKRGYIYNVLQKMEDVEKLDRGLYRLDAPQAGGVETAERVREIINAIKRLNIELAKGTETQDDLIDRGEEIRKRLEGIIEE